MTIHASIRVVLKDGRFPLGEACIPRKLCVSGDFPHSWMDGRAMSSWVGAATTILQTAVVAKMEKKKKSASNS